MTAAAEHLRGLARGIVDSALELVPLRAATLVGSAGRGDADRYSDIDLILYVDSLPSRETMAELWDAVGATNVVARGRTEHFCGDEFELEGVRTEVSFGTISRLEWRLEEVLDRQEGIDTPVQHVFVGVLDGLALHGIELVEAWQARLREYPDALRRALIEQHWHFFPLWYHAPAMLRRDAELWRQEVVLEAAFDLLSVLAALNRLYFSRHELKRTRELIAKMEVAPPELADRLESLFRLGPEEAGNELERLVDETRVLVAAALPDLVLPLAFPVGARREPWSPRQDGL